MIITGLSLALLTGAGFYLLFCKLPKRFQRFFLRNPLITDIIACISIYTLLGGTIVALFAAAWLGLIVSIMLALLNNKVTAEVLNQISKKLARAKELTMETLTTYFENKQKEALNER